MRWSAAEAAEIVEAARKAPVYSAGKPWVLELHNRSVHLYEVAHRSLHDPLGMDRLLTCGAALEHIVLAVRAIGWHAEVVFPADHTNPDLIAVVRADRRQPPDEKELNQHLAASLAEGTGDGEARDLVSANHWAGTELHPVDDDTLVVVTVGDGRPDHVRGGAALQAAVLAARFGGLRVRPVIHLMHRQEWRAGLIERHELAGYPQALLVVGAKDPDGAGPTAASAGAVRS
ncbi:hypothetical protein [Lentzea flaviverrucosa]|uniref:Uncharacterized protein n=1 Tax=Lentzea flaviverrucosa TaxID=200379 RepID=A0A1H9XXM8_9PSEU|nr:hypothetical protein [Lentzea flaviverrucosa]RDI34322.1 hypothetical protein DFR72_10169 [Lentzea flaviverrucosa]SES50507.1 hypothetical protein SAMN05216195_120138 [Lentzea flaviverrucosa]